jgi:hypothetical protein
MVKSMNSTKQHKKVRLSGNEDCSVVLCSECNVLELNFGASTLRINPESLQTISSILSNATERLAQVKSTTPESGDAPSRYLKRVH